MSNNSAGAYWKKSKSGMSTLKTMGSFDRLVQQEVLVAHAAKHYRPE